LACGELGGLDEFVAVGSMEQFYQLRFRIALRAADGEPLLFALEVAGLRVRLIPEIKNLIII